MTSGTKLLSGTVVKVEAIKGSDTKCKITTPDGKSYAANYTSVFRAPSIKTMEKWDYDGIGKTPSGATTEPDGHDPEGFPSWIRIIGLI